MWREMRTLVEASEVAGEFDPLTIGGVVRLLQSLMDTNIENPNLTLSKELTGERNIGNLLSPELRTTVASGT